MLLRLPENLINRYFSRQLQQKNIVIIQPEKYRTIKITGLIFCLFIVQATYSQVVRKTIKPVNPDRASLRDSMEVYDNAKAVQDFYERSGQYKKTHETRINTDDPGKIHAGNDKKYNEVVATIGRERLTSQGKRKIRPDEYRINIDRYKYRQRELSDYVLNMDAPMQLFDRRIAPQTLVDYTFTGNANSAINNDDVDFKMYDPIAVKPYSMLSTEEKRERDLKYPQPVKPYSEPVNLEKVIGNVKRPGKIRKTSAKSEFVISGTLPDSVRFKRFKSQKEAEDFIKSLPATRESD